MKKLFYIIIVVLFVQTKIYSQKLQDLKKSDTIYIEFKNKKNEHKNIVHAVIKSNNFLEREYVFELSSMRSLYFTYSTFKNFEKHQANTFSDSKKISKSFLNRNQDKIIKISNLSRFTYDDIVCEIFNHMKVLYIIDFTEKKKKEVKIYEVSSMNVCPVSE
jgi:hypothetical protein